MTSLTRLLDVVDSLETSLATIKSPNRLDSFRTHALESYRPGSLILEESHRPTLESYRPVLESYRPTLESYRNTLRPGSYSYRPGPHVLESHRTEPQSHRPFSHRLESYRPVSQRLESYRPAPAPELSRPSDPEGRLDYVTGRSRSPSPCRHSPFRSGVCKSSRFRPAGSYWLSGGLVSPSALSEESLSDSVPRLPKPNVPVLDLSRLRQSCDDPRIISRESSTTEEGGSSVLTFESGVNPAMLHTAVETLEMIAHDLVGQLSDATHTCRLLDAEKAKVEAALRRTRTQLDCAISENDELHEQVQRHTYRETQEPIRQTSVIVESATQTSPQRYSSLPTHLTDDYYGDYEWRRPNEGGESRSRELSRELSRESRLRERHSPPNRMKRRWQRTQCERVTIQPAKRVKRAETLTVRTPVRVHTGVRPRFPAGFVPQPTPSVHSQGCHAHPGRTVAFTWRALCRFLFNS